MPHIRLSPHGRGSRASVRAPAPPRRRLRSEPAPRLPMTMRGRGSSSKDWMASARAAGSSVGTRQPSAGVMSSNGPCAAAATTGRRADQASMMTLPRGSWREGQTKTSQAANKAAVSPIQPIRCARLPDALGAREVFQGAALLAFAGDHRVNAGQTRQSADQHVERLVAVQPAECKEERGVGRNRQIGGRGACHVGGRSSAGGERATPASPGR